MFIVAVLFSAVLPLQNHNKAIPNKLEDSHPIFEKKKLGRVGVFYFLFSHSYWKAGNREAF